jgi:hypothetical protein
MIRDVATAAAMALAAAATLRSDVRAGMPRWSPDSYDYAIRMLMRRGVPKEEATRRAYAFFTAKPIAHDERFAHAFVGEPEWWVLFTPRAVYPAVAAVLFPRRGFAALTDVAAASHVAGAVLLYRLLRRFGSRTTAATLTLWYVTRFPVRDAAAHGLSDSPAMLLWIAVLDAMVEIARGRARGARFAALAVLLSFTRPLPYMPFAAGAALALDGVVRNDRATVRAGATIAAVALGCAVCVAAVLARAGMPSTRAHFERVREGQKREIDGGRLDRLMARFGLADAPSHSMGRWYATTVALSVATTLKHALASGVPVLAVPALLRARRGDAALLLGALAGGVVGCVADPSPRATQRTVVLPMYPVFAAGGALALTALARWLRERFSG